MRYVWGAILAAAGFMAVTFVDARYGAALDPFLYTYVIHNFVADTGVRNSVASILVNYRMYDSIFEALILLTAIVGMHQFLPRAAGDVGDEENGNHG